MKALQQRQNQQRWVPAWELELVSVELFVDGAVVLEDQSAFGLNGIDLEALEGTHILEGDTILEGLHRAYLGILDRVEILVDQIEEDMDMDREVAAGSAWEEVVVVVAAVVAVVVLSALADADPEFVIEAALAVSLLQHLAKVV